MLKELSKSVKTVTTTIKIFEKYPLVALTETQYDTDGKKTSSRNIHPAKNVYFDYDYLKQLILVRARYENPCELPYSIDTLSRSYESDAQLCFSSLDSSALPKDMFADFERDILDYDFRIYDEKKCKSISAKYHVKPKTKEKIIVDEIALVESENGE